MTVRLGLAWLLYCCCGICCSLQAAGCLPMSAVLTTNCRLMSHVVGVFNCVDAVCRYSGFVNHLNIGSFMERQLTMRGGQTPVQRYW